MRNTDRVFDAAVLAAGMIWLLTCAARAAGETSQATTNLADRICRRYEESITSVSCGIRRFGGPAGVVSRVYFKRPDRVHVENVTPSKRRIVADGKNLYYFEEGSRRGFSQPVDKLEGEWLLSLQNIPGTPMRNILDLRNLAEEPLDPAGEYPIRRQFKTAQARIVLSCDDRERLLRLEFYGLTEPDNLMARYEYEKYSEVVPGCWMPMVHRTLVRLPDGQEFKEVTKVENLTVNAPVADSLFAWKNFFPRVEFTDDFQKTYEP
jgi:hypothetical protein